MTEQCWRHPFHLLPVNTLMYSLFIEIS